MRQSFGLLVVVKLDVHAGELPPVRTPSISRLDAHDAPGTPVCTHPTYSRR